MWHVVCLVLYFSASSEWSVCPCSGGGAGGGGGGGGGNFLGQPIKSRSLINVISITFRQLRGFFFRSDPFKSCYLIMSPSSLPPHNPPPCHGRCAWGGGGRDP